MTQPETTATGQTEDRPPDGPTGDRSGQSVGQVVNRLAALLENEVLGTGDAAALRRLDPEAPGGATFWKIVVGELEPAGQLDDGPGRGDHERRWAAILRCLGELFPVHQPRRRLGEALAAADVSEMRLLRLLRAESDLPTLFDTVRQVSHQIASKAERVDVGDLAWLVLTAGTERGEKTRRDVARDFYRAERRKTAES